MINHAKRAALNRPPPPVQVPESIELAQGVPAEPPPAPEPPSPPPPPPGVALDLSPNALDEFTETGLQKLYEAARTDFNVFAELVAVDDETGLPIRQAPIHRRWAKLCDEHDRLLIWSHINSGKTTQLSVLRSIWELGRDVTLRILILSNTATIATKIVRNISELIENHEVIKKIFPHLEPHPSGPWTTTELKVKRPGNSKDPSVRAMGVHGSLTGARVDRLIVDDILDPENTATEAARKKVSGWYKAVAVGRGSRRLRILVVGTAYHPGDLLHELAKQKRWKAVRFPVINSKGKVAWPSFWPPERIERLREELGPAEFARQLQCLARDDDEARFKQAWINEALRKGEGLSLVYAMTEEEIPEGSSIYTGVDIGVGKKKRNDLTCFFTFIEDRKGHRRVLWIESGKFTGPEIVEKIMDHHNRYHSMIAVENNAAQQFILDFTNKDFNVPVVPHTTTAAKRDPRLGVEGLAIELFNRKWTIPCDCNKGAPEVEAWIAEMLFYTPMAHTGDRLMACYFGRELARRLGNKSIPEVKLRVIGGETQPNQLLSN